MKIHMSVITALCLFAGTAFAEVKDQSKDTGRYDIIEDSISYCSQPPAFPTDNGLGFATVSAEFSYKICKEVETAQYEVSGSFWNTNATKIVGTERYSYVLVNVTGGQSQSILEERNDKGESLGFDFFQWTNAVGNVTSACSNERSLSLRQQVPKYSTKCASR